MIKKCVRCGAEFEARSPNAKYCLDCRVDVQCEQKRRWYKEHLDYHREHSRRWRTEHLDYYREYSRRWRKEHPEQEKASRIRSAFRLLIREGIIDGEKVLTDPTE